MNFLRAIRIWRNTMNADALLHAAERSARGSGGRLRRGRVSQNVVCLVAAQAAEDRATCVHLFLDTQDDCVRIQELVRRPDNYVARAWSRPVRTENGRFEWELGAPLSPDRQPTGAMAAEDTYVWAEMAPVPALLWNPIVRTIRRRTIRSGVRGDTELHFIAAGKRHIVHPELRQTEVIIWFDARKPGLWFRRRTATTRNADERSELRRPHGLEDGTST